MKKEIQRLKFATKAMLQANQGHCHEIFMDIELNEEGEEITFDIMGHDSHYAMDLARVFNLTYLPEAKGDRILHIIAP